MVVLPLRRLIGADVRIVQIVADVANMAEEMAPGVLGARAPEPRPDPPVDGRRVLERVALHRQAAQEDEAASVQDLVAEPLQPRAERRQGKILAPDLRQRQPSRVDTRQPAMELR